jgi:hypothetical protein
MGNDSNTTVAEPTESERLAELREIMHEPGRKAPWKITWLFFFINAAAQLVLGVVDAVFVSGDLEASSPLMAVAGFAAFIVIMVFAWRKNSMHVWRIVLLNVTLVIVMAIIGALG